MEMKIMKKEEEIQTQEIPVKGRLQRQENAGDSNAGNTSQRETSTTGKCWRIKHRKYPSKEDCNERKVLEIQTREVPVKGRLQRLENAGDSNAGNASHREASTTGKCW